MSFRNFADLGGFKVLAVARLSSSGYSLVCYLLNCLAAGIEEVLSSPGELSVLLGIPERTARQALEDLKASNIIQLSQTSAASTLVIRLVLDPSKWENLRRDPEKRKRSFIGDAHNLSVLRPHEKPSKKKIKGEALSEKSDKPVSASLSSGEALIFPSRLPSGPPQLKAIEGSKPLREKRPMLLESGEDVTLDHAAQMILMAFQELHPGVALELEKERNYAKLLAESYALAQVLALIKYFGIEVPSLGLLAGAWMHYSEKYQHHQHAIDDLSEFRNKNTTAEETLRARASTELKRSQTKKIHLNADEELLLRIFLRHSEPRKQLFWALQARHCYPHLQDFFEALKDLAQASIPRKH